MKSLFVYALLAISITAGAAVAAEVQRNCCMGPELPGEPKPWYNLESACFDNVDDRDKAYRAAKARHEYHFIYDNSVFERGSEFCYKIIYKD